MYSDKDHTQFTFYDKGIELGSKISGQAGNNEMSAEDAQVDPGSLRPGAVGPGGPPPGGGPPDPSNSGPPSMGSPNAPREIAKIGMLGSDRNLQWSRSADGVTVKLPEKPPCDYAYVFEIKPSGA